MHVAEAELTDPIRAGQTALTQLTRLWQPWGQHKLEVHDSVTF